MRVGGEQQRGPRARHASYPLPRRPSSSVGPGGGGHFSPWNGPAIFRWALSLPGCCPRVFLPSLPFPPRGQGGNHRVAVSVVGRSVALFTRRLGSYPPLPHHLASQGQLCSWDSTCSLWETLCGAYTAPWVVSPPRGGSSAQPHCLLLASHPSGLAEVWRPFCTLLAVDR